MSRFEDRERTCRIDLMGERWFDKRAGNGDHCGLVEHDIHIRKQLVE